MRKTTNVSILEWGRFAGKRDVWCGVLVICSNKFKLKGYNFFSISNNRKVKIATLNGSDLQRFK
jgi:hypothetical protein